MDIALAVLATILAIYLLGAVGTFVFMRRTSKNHDTVKDVLLCIFAWWAVLPFLVAMWAFIKMITPNYKTNSKL